MSDWRTLGNTVRNRGRWGDDDQLGTLNLITEQKVTEAAALVRTGRMFSLSIPVDGDGPQGAHGMRRNPIHLMSVDGTDADLADRLGEFGGAKQKSVAAFFNSGPMRFNDDYLLMPPQAGTQWDALSHVYYDGELYNGFPSGTVTSMGAARLAIDVPAGRGQVISRGVLLDVARHRGLPVLEPSTVILPEHLDEVAAAQGVEITAGDVVLVRTGWRTAFTAGMPGSEWLASTPGLSWRCAEWLWRHDVAAVASDNMTVEVMPPEDGVMLPLHMLTLRDMGMMLGEIWDLEALGADCEADGVYEFMLSAQPLKITGGVGSPINPVAIK